MVIGGMTKHTGSLAMAERTNLAVIMYGCGYELDSVIDSEGNLKSIKNFVLTYVSIVRMIGKRLRSEVVLLLLTKDHTTMQEIRDNLLEIKDAHYEGWFKIKKFGVSYFYVQSIEHALSMKAAPDVYSGSRNLTVFNIDENCSSVEIVGLVGRITGKKIINIQLEEQRNKKDELLIDGQKRERRVYLFVGDAQIEVTNEMIREISSILRKTLKVEEQVVMANKLPFWTTSYHFYLNRTGQESNKGWNMSEKTSTGKIMREGNQKYVSEGVQKKWGEHEGNQKYESEVVQKANDIEEVTDYEKDWYEYQMQKLKIEKDAQLKASSKKTWTVNGVEMEGREERGGNIKVRVHGKEVETEGREEKGSSIKVRVFGKEVINKKEKSGNIKNWAEYERQQIQVRSNEIIAQNDKGNNEIQERSIGFRNELMGEISNIINVTVQAKIMENNAMILEKMEKDKADIQKSMEQIVASNANTNAGIMELLNKLAKN